ncbi:polysaccharide pyruvyl transferase family protein [Marinobacter zhanjiangensis]|uniref:Polysaccharide pyruvyl transferase domain-containing protein n=1 Tax=Marinobacter zhanjiangensis TaxID=578215 RepID=A0ABQ3AW85_9GAMM|nr:polysaccharide pyruvyl transferase family protein [Marinobacter zhanjiangensis]GGY69805.1 hypothetical protein GCM10007071_15880 [Marinobacter zhanjiangensis]
MRILIVGVKYSANLGDGVIACCLEGALQERFPAAEVESLDLSGKTRFGGHGIGRRSSLLNQWLTSLPGRIRSLLASSMHVVASRLVLRQRWLEQVATADVIVIGGGQLFDDRDHYFPSRIGQVLDIARSREIPVCLFAVGVTHAMTRPARYSFARSLQRSRLEGIWARDAASLSNFKRFFPRFDPHLCRDPGFLSHLFFEASPQNSVEPAPPSKPRIGLCITNPVTLRPLSGLPGGCQLDAHFYAELIAGLDEDGMDCVVFCSGLEMDQAFVGEVEAVCRRHFPRSGQRVYFAERLLSPDQMVSLISSLDGVVAQRMHPTIVAYAYRVPHVGLGWHRKLESFFTSVGRDAFLIPPDQHEPAHVRQTLHRALEAPISEEKHAETTAETHEGFQALASVIEQTQLASARRH